MMTIQPSQYRNSAWMLGDGWGTKSAPSGRFTEPVRPSVANDMPRTETGFIEYLYKQRLLSSVCL